MSITRNPVGTLLAAMFETTSDAFDAYFYAKKEPRAWNARSAWNAQRATHSERPVSEDDDNEVDDVAKEDEDVHVGHGGKLLMQQAVEESARRR